MRVERRVPIIIENLPATNDSYRHIAARRSGNHAEAVVMLIDDEPRRAHLGELGRARVGQELAWSRQERAYLGMYQRLTVGARALERTGS